MAFRMFRPVARNARQLRVNQFRAPTRVAQRSVATASSSAFRRTSPWVFAGIVGTGLLTVAAAGSAKIDYQKVREEIADLLADAEDYDDGSYGPVVVRLAWHASGTYSIFDHDGGSDGATMRFVPECKFGANAGLDVPRKLLETIKKKYPEMSYADLWTLAGCVAIESMNGPKINWRAGRVDGTSGKECPPDGRLPDAARGADHLRAIFYRMGFSDQEIVALTGAHALGRCHTDRSGYDGPWTYSPTVFSNDFYKMLLEEQWTERDWNGPRQFQNKNKDLMMLPADLSLIEDPDFRKWVEVYAADQDRFFNDFAAAFEKLIHLGVPFNQRA